MFALVFHFPARRYHATPWGRNVNEADVAWPPEPWRLLRALIATWWRKGDHERWTEEHIARLIDALAASLPVYRLPEGAIHAHTRHYMPIGAIDKGRERTTLIFDAFVYVPDGAVMVVAWPDVALEPELFELASDLADALGYLGRAESWTECEALSSWNDTPNCGPVEAGFSGDPMRLLAPHTPASYAAERKRLIGNLERQIREEASKPLTEREIKGRISKRVRSSKSNADTLPDRLVDALILDTADYQDRGWTHPPAAREVVYARASETVPRVVPTVKVQRSRSRRGRDVPTVARFLLAGRPRPRVEDTVKLGELMRLAALSQFGWQVDEATGRRIPKAPWQISGRGSDGRPLKDPLHPHAFWLPEDADEDGFIDHLSVFIASGIDDAIQARLDRITRLWVAPKQQAEDAGTEPASAKEWRLALEGFGRPSDFAGGARIFAASTQWRSVTPFLATGHLKAAGYRGEALRLLKRRGFDTDGIEVVPLREISVGSTPRRAIHFHRFRSRGREAQPDAGGALLRITFPSPIEGPLAIGYGSHFGLGLFVSAS